MTPSTSPHRDPTPEPATVPLVAGPWQRFALSAQESLLQRLRPLCLDLPGLEPGLLDRVAGLRALALPFYDDGHLLDIEAAGPDGGRAAVTLFQGAGCLQVVTGQAGWVHELNTASGAFGSGPGARLSSAGLRADLQAAGPAYLKFFCGVVWGSRGPFRIVEAADDPALAAAPPEAPWRRQVTPVRAVEGNAEDSLTFEAVVLYGGDLFRADFTLLSGGLVVMRSDEAIAGDAVPALRTQSPWHSMAAAVRP